MERFRNSPSGKYIGDPGLRAGPSMSTLAWRAHADATASAVPTADVGALEGLSAIAVDMQPEYLYELELVLPVTVPATAAANVEYSTYYRVRTASTGAWGNWTLMMNGAHLVANAATYGGSVVSEDKKFGVQVTAPVDQIAFGLQGTVAGASVNNRGSFAVVREYL